ncbi:SDR family NAD(P)-dependent oxidoreductase [Sediminitomix flava]|uniref:Short-subunit dehydrogenase n=1 Tax=Sediminitomix flava TaxID=379075 RepID=A0A315ZY69_SEDFL|nr:SDR family NAD(P)-dependent oxidoreductase [Sediminitomix flava]PWJ42297.1 hypothetical protein BC781_103549 [Sediminitomix flava]
MKQIYHQTYTVITGASQGLGKALAYKCAQYHRNLILISLPNEGIESLGKAIKSTHKVNVKTYELDLVKEELLNELIRSISESYKVDMLINNAGVGGTKRFSDATEKYIDNIISINIRALVILTRGFLPLLEQNQKAYILNISSLASFGAMPFKTIYPASKAFVRSFSVGLATELEDKNIQVSVAYPGGMPTNKEVTDRINTHNDFVKSTILSAEEVAEICMREVFEGKTEIIPGAMSKLSRLFFMFCPSFLRLKMFKKNVLREIQQQEISNYAS